MKKSIAAAIIGIVVTTAYAGPKDYDVSGIKLGMSRNEVVDSLKRTNPKMKSVEMKNNQGELVLIAAGNAEGRNTDQIMVNFLPEKQTVFYIERTINYAKDNQPTIQSVVEAAKKYGEIFPLANNSSTSAIFSWEDGWYYDRNGKFYKPRNGQQKEVSNCYRSENFNNLTSDWMNVGGVRMMPRTIANLSLNCGTSYFMNVNSNMGFVQSIYILAVDHTSAYDSLVEAQKKIEAQKQQELAGRLEKAKALKPQL